jgi:hypothetical protein
MVATGGDKDKLTKYFRPLTIFSCHRAINPGPIPETILNSAVVIEFFHNVSLVIDDIVDRSDERRDRLTLPKQFGELNALMASGYIVAEGYLRLRDDVQAIGQTPVSSQDTPHRYGRWSSRRGASVVDSVVRTNSPTRRAIRKRMAARHFLH